MLRLLFAIPLAGACVYLIAIGASDPFGATTREQIRANAAVQIAQTQAAAQVQTAATWASVLPAVTVIIVLGVLASIVLYFRGKVYVAQQQTAPPLSLPEVTDYDEAIGVYAALTNQRLIVHQGEYYLVDQATGKTLRARPKLSLPPD
jgi:hypothetical protein